MHAIGLIIRYATFALALAGFVSIASVMQQIHAEEQTQQISPPPVAPPSKPYASTVAGTGILEALSENVSIGVPSGGLVTEVFVKVNDAVTPGTPLLKLDDRDLQAALLKQRASIEVARANLEVARANLQKMEDMFRRVRDMPDKRSVSVDEVRQRENDVNVAQAQVRANDALLLSAQADVQQTEQLINRLTVRAPRAGTILQVNIRAGEYAGTSPKTPAMVLGDLEKLQVRVDIDEQNAQRVRPGQVATAFLKGDTLNPIPLEFVRIEPYVIPKVSLTGASTERVDTRVLQVIYSLTKPKNSGPIYVGQQADVYIDAQQHAPQP
ncbi:MAG: efflux RND transporter periplasmic adaptor subunit [Roseimicrobium sp.]